MQSVRRRQLQAFLKIASRKMGSFLDDAPAVVSFRSALLISISLFPLLPVLIRAICKMYGNTIRKNNGYDPGSYTYYPIAIIGAGESGIAMACRLKEVLGFNQFRIFDRQAGIGGTWWINRYPGVACDV